MNYIDLTTDAVDAPRVNSSLSDEITINADKVNLLEQNRFVINERFNVTLSLKRQTRDGKQWLELHGIASQRKKAKDYMKALCNPSDSATVRIPPDLSSLLTMPAIRKRLEETTQAVLVFTSQEEVIIQGIDSLSVALAMSSVEDIICKHNTDARQKYNRKGNSKTLLDGELRRLSSEDRSSMLNDDYSIYNDDVKRTVIEWMREEGDPSSMEVDLDVENRSKKQEQKKEEKISFETGANEFSFNFVLPPLPSVDQIQNDPVLRPKILDQPTDHHLGRYMARRFKDDEEEASNVNLDREALIRKNEGRQELLREAYKQREEEKASLGARAIETIVIDEEDKTLAESLTEIDLDPSEKRSVSTDNGPAIMDTLDDFSLPVVRKNKHKRIHASASPQNRETKKAVRHQRKKSPSPPKSNHVMSQKNRPGPSFTAVRRKSPSPSRVHNFAPPQAPAAAPMFFIPRNPVPAMPQQVVQPSHPPGALRYVVIDGSNIALAHGNHRVFSCKGIQICIDFFRRRGHTEITAFVPQTRTRAPTRDKPIAHQHLLEEMREQGTLVFTPARRVLNKDIVCYDDNFIVRLAHQTDGIMVSNDNFRDIWNDKPQWHDTIQYRLVGYSFVGDIFMLPDDPLGRTGPCLDDFLRKPQHNQIRHHSQPIPKSSVPTHGPPRMTLQPPVLQSRSHSSPLPFTRTEDQTNALRKELNAIFVGNEKAIRRVLDANPTATSMNQLSEFILQTLDIN